MTLFNKFKWILGILIVFLLILATNLIDKRNFQRVRDSIVNIYEDRLIAKDVILDISSELHTKHIAVVSRDTAFFKNKNERVNKNIADMLDRFEQTQLTEREQLGFNLMSEELTSLKAVENSADLSKPEDVERLTEKMEAIDESLSKLAEIQMEEGRRQKKLGKSAVESIELFTQIELYFLLAMAIVVQLIILYTPSKLRK